MMHKALHPRNDKSRQNMSRYSLKEEYEILAFKIAFIQPFRDSRNIPKMEKKGKEGQFFQEK